MSRPDLRTNAAVGPERRAFFLYVLVFSSLILLLFSLMQEDDRALGLNLANVLASIALTDVLVLDHVQATLSEPAIRTIRYLGFAAFSLYAVDTVSLLIDRLTPALGFLVPGLVNPAKRSQWQRTKTLYFRFLSASVLAAFAYSYAQSWMTTRPDKVIDQYLLLKYAVNGVAIFGVVLLGIAAVFGFARVRSREDEEALAHADALSTALASATVFLLFSLTHQQALNRWVKFSLGANTWQVLQVASVPVLSACSILVLMIFAFRRQALYRRILPEATTELLKQSRYGKLDPDQTASEHNWILLNDVVGSSPLKVTTLEILSHMIQSVFHKIHKTYFKDSIRFLNSLGDALLITIKTPPRPQGGDPILEKLVRCYALHRDGAEALRKSDRLLSALLALRERELYLAIGDQRRRRESLQVSVDNLRFRTLLTANYYYYGVNYEISNIDSRHVYVLSKAEKQVDTGKQGGFIVFPDLMRVLRLSVPRIEEFFEAVRIERNGMHPAIAAAVPEEAYRLREDRREDFDRHLEELYGAPLYLRVSPGAGDPYQVVGKELEEFCARLREMKSSCEVLAELERKLPALRNFAEKDHLIITVSEALCRADYWQDGPGQERMRERLWKFLTDEVGVPTQKLIEAISENDASLAPQALLSDLRSLDAVRRNRAMRSMPLARTRNPFRPSAMPREEFARAVLRAYLERFQSHSVESHVGLWAYFERDAVLLKSIRELLAGSAADRERFDALLGFLEAHPTASLRSLGVWLRSFSESGELRRGPAKAA